MAKRRSETVEDFRQSRKEVLLARRRARHNRQIQIVVGAVVALLVVILIAALIAEYGVKPGQPVAVVNGEAITTRQFQERVRFQRTQIILGIEDLTETLQGDVGLVQQYAGQQMQLLQDPVTLGQLVLDDMIDGVLVRQGAQARGITVSDEELQDSIEESFSFFDGELPTPLPTPTQTVAPTPSLTPIPTAVITEVVPTNTPFPTATIGPTNTPLPTATPISQEAFNEDFNELVGRFRAHGVSEQTYREAIRAQLYQERLRDALAVERELPEEDEHTSFFYIAFTSDVEAENTRRQIADDDFLAVWNAIRSRPLNPAQVEEGEEDEEARSTASAGEILWRTRDAVANTLAEAVANAAFSLAVGETSAILVDEAESEEELSRYFIIRVSGREVRPLAEGEITNQKQQALADWIEQQRVNVDTFDRWRSRVPRQPVLAPRYLLPPTQAPLVTQPPITLPTPEPATPTAAPTDDGT